MAALTLIPPKPPSPELVCAVRVPATMHSLAFIRCAVAAMLERGAWPGESGSRMVLAASEAVTNAIEHGSVDHASVVVELTVAIDRARLSVTDAGRPGARCPVLDAAPTPPPPTSVRGRGLVIMFGLADGLDVEPVGSGTRVSMEFRRDSCAV